MELININSCTEDILVVDDTLDNLDLLEEILDKAGYPVRTAYNGNLALKSVYTRLPGLILLDIQMPGMDGYEFCRRLKADIKTKSIPVIFISVLGNEQEKIKGFKTGGVDYISKPFYSEEVVARVNTHLTLRRIQLNLEKLVIERTNDLKLSNQKLQKQIRETQGIIDTANEGFWMIDHDSRTTSINSRLLGMLGYKKNEMIGKTLDAFVFKNDLPDHHMKMDNLYKGNSERYERYWQTKSEQLIFSITSATPLIDSEKKVYGAFIMITDISDRKRVEADRENLIKQLKDKNSELESFSYTVSHDLKNPLNNIKGFATLIQKELSNRDFSQIIDHIEHIINTSNKMKFLLEDLLHLSRIGRTTGTPVKVALSEIVKETVELLSGMIMEREAEIDIASDLPIIHVDRSRFLQVMENLISNAIKFMGEQKDPQIKIGCLRENNETICYISDNGIGIAPENQDKIFNLFERIDLKSSGTGVGLAIVKKVLSSYNCRIWVESQGTGKGTTFFFTVPISPDYAFR